jgi:glycogen debranching enzyme
MRTILAGGTALLSDTSGDVTGVPGGRAQATSGDGPAGRSGDDLAKLGLYAADTRHVSRWRLRLESGDGQVRDLAVAARTATASVGSVALLPGAGRNVPTDVLVVRTQQVDARGLVETVELRSTGRSRVTGRLLLSVSADFVDQFQVRAEPRPFERGPTRRDAVVAADGVTLTYVHDHPVARIARSTDVRSVPAPSGCSAAGSDAELTWDLDVPAGGVVTIVLDVRVGDGSGEKEGAPGAVALAAPGPGAVRTAPSAARLEPANLGPADVALADIDALTMACPGLPHLAVPSAGAPWFLTLFGRDSILTSLMVGSERPALLPAVVRALAATQATHDDPARAAETGKIVHEIRGSELCTLGVLPYSRYYGAVDTTALFLVALASAPRDVVRTPEIEASARAAVAWLRGPGGLDQHGLVRYEPHVGGLVNQGWKDSFDAVPFADGTLASGSVALVEVQGYTWRALTETARLAREVWGDPAWADELDVVAGLLSATITRDLWLDDHDFPALALDGQGRRCDVLASNAGHLLWAGVLDPVRARQVADRLLEPDFFTGWGLRTVASGQVPYSPMSYHNGSVWPHDTMIAALGMERYGLLDHARRLAEATLRAAAHHDHRLPELFGGFADDEFPRPVAYRHAGTPQAWAAAATVVAARLARR